jgi:hypothetical protein
MTESKTKNEDFIAQVLLQFEEIERVFDGNNLTMKEKVTTNIITKDKKRKSKTLELEDDEFESKKLKTVHENSSEFYEKKKWYTCYQGALAYAILKGNTWKIRNDGYLDIKLESNKKKVNKSLMK